MLSYAMEQFISTEMDKESPSLPLDMVQALYLPSFQGMKSTAKIKLEEQLSSKSTGTLLAKQTVIR